MEIEGQGQSKFRVFINSKKEQVLQMRSESSNQSLSENDNQCIDNSRNDTGVQYCALPATPA